MVSANERLTPDLSESPRFQLEPTRRNFLGLAALGSSAVALGTATLGALLLPMPAVFPESNPRVKLGLPDTYPKGSAVNLPKLGLWLFRDEQGFYAISSICTHLGCVAKRKENGEFKCPCHGSHFDANGKVLGGPAPKGLNWLAMNVAPDGQLIVDQVRTTKAGTRLQV